VGSKKSDSPKKTIAAAAKQPAAPKSKGKAPPAKSNGASAAKAAPRDEDDDEDDDERSSSAPPPAGAKANGKTKEQLIKLGREFAAQALHLGAHPHSVPEEWRRGSRQASTDDYCLLQYVFGHAVRCKRKHHAAPRSEP
jgi:hypothetical protein